MRVLIPATREPAWDGGEVAPLDPRDDGAYWRFWRDTWKRGESVIVVEHDITPTPDVLADLESCPGDWCAQPYPYINGGTYTGLGCVKFTGALMAAVPGLWDQVAAMSDHGHPPRHWCRLDAWSHHVLTAWGCRRCEHRLTVGHTPHAGSSHGCC